MTPLLEVLRDHGELDRHTASDLVVRQMGLTPEQIALSHETTGKISHQGRNRVGFFSPEILRRIN